MTPKSGDVHLLDVSILSYEPISKMWIRVQGKVSRELKTESA